MKLHRLYINCSIFYCMHLYTDTPEGKGVLTKFFFTNRDISPLSFYKTKRIPTSAGYNDTNLSSKPATCHNPLYWYIPLTLKTLLLSSEAQSK